MVQTLHKTVWTFLKKLKTDLPYDPMIPPLGNISRENYNLKKYVYPVVPCSTIYSSQDMEATQMSIDR